MIEKILIVFYCSFLITGECEKILNASPWSAFIPIYGDYKLWKLTQLLNHNTQALHLKEHLLDKNNAEIKGIVALGAITEKDRLLAAQLIPYISRQEQATFLYALFTMGSLVIGGFMIYANQLACGTRVHDCPYTLDITIPAYIFLFSLPLFIYRSSESILRDYKRAFTNIPR